MQPKFDPSFAGEHRYMRPNDNQIPGLLNYIGKSSMAQGPSMHALMRMPFIVKGRSLDASRVFTSSTGCAVDVSNCVPR
jgi:hypothetical protein